MQFVEFNEVISEAMLEIGAGDDQVAQNSARQWAWRALQFLGSADSTIEVCKVAAKNGIIPLPKNCKQLDEAALYDDNDCFLPHVFHTGAKRIYPNVESYTYTYTTDDGEEVRRYLPIDLSQQGNKLILGSNGEDIVSYAYIRFYPYPLDTSGNPLIREDEVPAVIAYIVYKWSKRKRENQSEIALNYQTWKEMNDFCKGQKKSSDFSNEVKKSIASQWLRMIPNFNRSRF